MMKMHYDYDMVKRFAKKLNLWIGPQLLHIIVLF